MSMRRLVVVPALAVFLALVAGGCSGDFGCCGSLDRLSPVRAVVDAQVVDPDAGERASEGANVSEGTSLVLEVEAVRTPAGSSRVQEGDRIVAAHDFSEYELDSNELTFFLVSGGPLGGEWRVAYVHDRTLDAPVAGFPDRASPYGASLTEMFECLVREHRIGEGDDPILRALVAETLDSKLDPACNRPPEQAS